MAKNKALLLCV